MTLLPKFLDNAHSVAITQHSMDIIKATVQHLNPSTLSALHKEVQWTWLTSPGEDHLMIMFGGPHKSMLKCWETG